MEPELARLLGSEFSSLKEAILFYVNGRALVHINADVLDFLQTRVPSSYQQCDKVAGQ